MLVENRASMTPITVHKAMLYMNALKLMREHTIRRLPVVDEAGALVGLVTERDLFKAASRFGNVPVEVEDIMEINVLTINSEMPLQDAAEIMLDKKVGSLPIVNDQNIVVGIITESDIFREFVRMMNDA